MIPSTTHNSYKMAKIWTFFALITLVVCILFFQESSYMEIDALSIWILSCLAILYLSTKPITRFIENRQIYIIIIGFLMCIGSFVAIPLGITNPPYTIGEVSLLLSGIGVVLFGFLNYRSLVLPVSIPFIAVAGWSGYELFLRNQEWITAPFIPDIVLLTTSMLNLLGIETLTRGNSISFISQSGVPIYLSIVSDCTGIWSLGTFTISVIIVLSSFPESITRKSFFLIGIGYIGTFCANILRIFLIAMSGFFFGPSGVIEQVHVHIGWICFTLWLIIFWYYFFTRQIGISFSRKQYDKG